jgi:thiol reductant ABC exporter CydD subunit
MRQVDRRLLGSAGAARGYIVLTGAIAAATAGLVVVQAFVLADVVAGAFEPTARPGSGRAFGLLAAVVMGRAALSWCSAVSAGRAAAGVKSQLRRRLLEHVVRLGPAWLSRQQPGDLAVLATRGTDALDPYFAGYLPSLVGAAVIPLCVVAVILSQDLLAGTIVLLTLPLVPVFAALVGLTTRQRTRRSWQTLSTLGGHFLDIMEGLPTLLAFRRAAAQVETIRRVSEEYRAANWATLRLAFLSSAVLEFVATISVALVAVSTGLRLLNGHLDLRTAVVVLILAPEAYWPLRQMGAQFHASADGLAVAERLFAVLDTPLDDAQTEDSRVDHGAAGVGARRGRCDLSESTIRLQGLSVTYGRAQPALPRLDLEVSPGEHVGIRGPSGSGKSTLLGVLLGFVPNWSGRILVDGRHGCVEMVDLDVDDWRRQISWVPQRPWLAPASISDNVRVARPTAGDAAVARALDLAQATDFVANLPRGAATVLGPHGAGLSAGQRQRIALARAFLRDSPLVLLDEPTAHLDAASEAAVVTAVRLLAADRTTISVAHRPALLAGADRIVLLGGTAETAETVRSLAPFEVAQ